MKFGTVCPQAAGMETADPLSGVESVLSNPNLEFNKIIKFCTLTNSPYQLGPDALSL